jgi:type I restriction enzyme R subunit
MSTNATEANTNEYSRFDDLKSTVDKTKAKEYFEKQEDGISTIQNKYQQA